MGIVLQMFTRWMYEPPLFKAVIFAFVGVVAISYGFELFSKITGMGVYDVMDAVASVIGGLLGMVVVLVAISLM
jgi:glycopeptide antibiotics resistance protein